MAMPDPSRRRLAWRCRRGIRELDLLLSGWLEAQFDSASPAQRARFAALLERPDPWLAHYLLTAARPEQRELALLIDSIVARARIMSANSREPSASPRAQSPIGASLEPTEGSYDPRNC
jgi:antitoxin CptB